jgi:hypothetical protein
MQKLSQTKQVEVLHVFAAFPDKYFKVDWGIVLLKQPWQL